MDVWSSDTFVLWHFTERVLLVAIEAQQIVVVLPESFTVRNCNQCDVHFLHVGVEETFNIDRDSRGALVKNGIQRFVIDQSSHGDSLFFTTRENISPVVVSVPTVLFTCNNMCQTYVLHDSQKVLKNTHTHEGQIRN